MLDINLIRNNPNVVRADLKKRNDKNKLAWVDETIRLDKEWRGLRIKTDKLRHRRNEIALKKRR